MPTLQAPLQPDGALVEVQIGWSALDVQRYRLAGRPIPQPATFQNLIDTGADTNYIDPAALRKVPLPVQALNFANVPALGGSGLVIFRDASLRIADPSGYPLQDLVIDELLLAEVALATLGYELLLGRDVLQACRFLYDGPVNQFELSWT